LTLEWVKKNWFGSEKIAAHQLYNSELNLLLSAIDEVRSLIVEKASEIDRIAESSRGNTYNWALLQCLPNEYSVGDIQVKLLPLVDLSTDLMSKERPYIGAAQISRASARAPEIRDTTATLVVDTMAPKDSPIISLREINTIEDLSTLDELSFRALLQEAIDTMEMLYLSQLSDNIGDDSCSYPAVSIPEKMDEQVTFWRNYICWLGESMKSQHAWELKIFWAFKDLPPETQNSILNKMY
jgi:hypothetical protein